MSVTLDVTGELDSVGDMMIIRFSDAWGDSISAERLDNNKVAILTLSVYESRRRQGRGTDLVECLIANLPSGIKSVAIKGANDAPEFWKKMKNCTGGKILDL
jgi:hypothetical protein